MSRTYLGDALAGQERYAEAEAEYRWSLATTERLLGPDNPRGATPHNNLADALEAQGKYAEAEMEYRHALLLWDKGFGSDHPLVALSRTNLARTLLEQNRARQAVPLAEQAWDRHQDGGTRTDRRAETGFVLARALWATGAHTRARSVAKRALAAFREAEDPYADHVRRWIETRRPGKGR